MLRMSIGAVAWTVATVISVAIIYSAMGTNSWIVTGIGGLGIIASSTGIYLAREAFQERAFVAGILSMGMWAVGCAVVVPTEINFWSATVTAKSEHESDVLRQANARRMVMDEAAEQIRKEKPLRTSIEVNAEIEKALAKKDGRLTLGGTTSHCTDVTSPSYRRCNDVLALRIELAKAESYEKQTALVWDANTQVTHAEDAHGAHDGAARMAHFFGGNADDWSDRILGTIVALLAFMRDLTLFITWRPRPVKVPKKEIALSPTAVEPDHFHHVVKMVSAQEKKVYPAIEAMKANAKALKGNAIDAAVAAVRAKRGDDALPLNEIMGELAVVHEARGLPQPSVGHSKAVGKRMEKLGFETVGRHQAYKEKKRGSHKHKATASA